MTSQFLIPTEIEPDKSLFFKCDAVASAVLNCSYDLESKDRTKAQVEKVFERKFRIPVNSIRIQFRILSEQWRRETDSLSLVHKKAKHPAYRKIIEELNEDAVPLILEELSERGGHWFWALSEITKENPIPSEAAGNVALMKSYWLKWGKDNGKF